ncbi:MAG: hypothetical protein WDN24_07755 [Sphingomonas sp.]
MTRVALALLALPLVACNPPTGNTTVSIHGDADDVSVRMDGSGGTTVTAPGVDLSVRLPKIQIDEKDFEVNGVKLYPGSTIKDFNLNAGERSGDKDHGKLRISFDSPAALDKVQAWFRDNMAQRGFKMRAAGSGFAGTTDKGDPITIDLSAAGADKSSGTMTVGS